MSGKLSKNNTCMHTQVQPGCVALLNAFAQLPPHASCPHIRHGITMQPATNRLRSAINHIAHLDLRSTQQPFLDVCTPQACTKISCVDKYMAGLISIIWQHHRILMQTAGVLIIQARTGAAAPAHQTPQIKQTKQLLTDCVRITEQPTN